MSCTYKEDGSGIYGGEGGWKAQLLVDWLGKYMSQSNGRNKDQKLVSRF